MDRRCVETHPFRMVFWIISGTWAAYGRAKIIRIKMEEKLEE